MDQITSLTHLDFDLSAEQVDEILDMVFCSAGHKLSGDELVEFIHLNLESVPGFERMKMTDLSLLTAAIGKKYLARLETERTETQAGDCKCQQCKEGD